MDSISVLSSFVQLSHIGPPNSSSGRIKEIYMRSKESLSSLNLKALKIFIRCHAFFTISSIWACPLQSWENIKPKCVCVSTSFKTVLSINRWGWRSLLCFREMIIVSVLDGLKFTSQSPVQECMRPKLLFRILAAVTGFSTTIKKLVSSAKNRTLQLSSHLCRFEIKRSKYGPLRDACFH